MTEDFHDLLTGEHLFHKAVHVSQVGLLRVEELRRPTAQLARGVDHHHRHEEGEDGKRQTQHDHTGKGEDDGDERGEEVRHGADHLAQRVDIVGIDRHGVAVGMGVEILDGQLLHMTEHIDAQALQGALTHVDHQPTVDIGTQGAHHEHGREFHQGVCQRGEIRMLHLREGQDIIVDECSGEEGRGEGGDRGDEDTYQYGQQRPFVVHCYIADESSDELHSAFGHLGDSHVSSSVPASSAGSHSYSWWHILKLKN